MTQRVQLHTVPWSAAPSGLFQVHWSTCYKGPVEPQTPWIYGTAGATWSLFGHNMAAWNPGHTIEIYWIWTFSGFSWHSWLGHCSSQPQQMPNSWTPGNKQNIIHISTSWKHDSACLGGELLCPLGGFQNEGTRIAGWFIIWNPNLKWMITGGTLQNTDWRRSPQLSLAMVTGQLMGPVDVIIVATLVSAPIIIIRVIHLSHYTWSCQP